MQHLFQKLFAIQSAGLLAIVAASAVRGAEEVELFKDGALDGWVEEQHDFFKKKHPDVKTWTVKDGVVACDGSLGNCGFLRYDKKQFADFKLQLEYRMSKACNSGVCIRSPKPFDGRVETLPSRIGYEVQIFDDAGQPASKTSSGAFYGKLAPTVNAAKPAGEWNTLEIVCDGPKIRVTLNGQVVQDVNQTEVDVIKDRPAAGYLLLQNHGSLTEFRKLKLTDMAKRE